MRPLGIPTMKDRAMQELYRMALDPIAETRADPNSYGFRRGRSCADAIQQLRIVLSQRKSARFILDADIKSCFDRISHDWLIANIPMDKAILRKWLKSGYLEKYDLLRYRNRHAARRDYLAHAGKSNLGWTGNSVRGNVLSDLQTGEAGSSQGASGALRG